MADDIQFDIAITIPTSVEPAGDMPDKWAAGLVNNAAVINDRRTEKIPDEGTFQAKMAVPSSNKFSPMIDAAFVADSGRNAANIIRAQYKNLAGAFDHWNDKLALAFATVDGVVAKRFVDQVNNSKDNWATAAGQKTLRATGDKIRGTILGQILFWGTGDYKAHQMVNHMEVVGTPYDFCQPGMERAWKAAMMGTLVQGCIQIITADFLAAEIAAMNNNLSGICSRMTGPGIKPWVEIEASTPADCAIGFRWTDPEFKLQMRIVTV